MLIGIVGFKGSGKDSIANRLAMKAGFETVAFADPVRWHASKILNLKTIDQYDTFKRSKFIGPLGEEMCGRHIIREIGMTMLDVDPNVFTKRISDILEANGRNGVNTIVTDVRMDSEYKLIRQYGGVIVKVVRENTESHDQHITERSFPNDQCDVIINNDSDIITAVNNLLEALQHYGFTPHSRS